MDRTNDKLVLRNVEVAFANLEKDGGYGTSLNIKVDTTNETKIKEWVKINKIGKKTPGEANFNTYDLDGQECKRFIFKINKETRFEGANGLTKSNLGTGAIVNLIARAVPYNYMNEKGVGQVLTAVYVVSGTHNDDDMEELIGSSKDDEAKLENEVKTEDRIEELSDLSDIPF